MTEMGYVNQIFGIEGMLAPFAVGVVAKATILVVVAGLFSLLLVRASAAARHLVWASAIGGVLLLPLLTAATPWTWEVLPRLQGAPIVTTPQVTPDAAGMPAIATNAQPVNTWKIFFMAILPCEWMPVAARHP